jgi:hypothetical protein
MAAHAGAVFVVVVATEQPHIVLFLVLTSVLYPIITSLARPSPLFQMATLATGTATQNGFNKNSQAINKKRRIRSDFVFKVNNYIFVQL